ncbi:MAG: 8-oxo-dGTP diphosphatase MutT [Proteobacteria bacterium]|nr:8-oxo-dGTP diphosphatase MutT [Pseudomonadota bacterium]MCL2307448.1 8-oxo-dGTP diphosphatase MutT [Pseudomonadota bacterium]
MKFVQAAAAVLTRSGNEFLLAQRPPGKVYADYWEFPGGKIEAGETGEAALIRELEEELGIVVEQAAPWQIVHFTYPHAEVELHFFHVTAWRGEPYGREGQNIGWQTLETCRNLLLLPANHGVLKALPALLKGGA